MSKLRSLIKARAKYEELLDAVEKEVAAKCDFPASVQHIEGDGFVILNLDTEDVASISIIHRKRRLTEAEHAASTF